MSPVRAVALPAAHELLANIASRKVSPVELVDAARRAYEERNPRLNAIVTR